MPEKKKKEKKQKEEDEDIICIDIDTDNTASVAAKKEKKSKKRKAEKELDRLEDVDADIVDHEVVEAAVTTLECPVPEEIVHNDERTQTDDVQKHEKQLKNKLPTRQERQRRENQKKMQTFVAEMRALGKTKKEIDKLKKKVNAKLKHIQPNQEFSAVISFGDIQLSCRDCNADFVFSVQEQHYYQEKQYPPPVRCKECTAAKKVRMAGFDKKDAAWGAGANAGAGYQQGGGYGGYRGGGGQWTERAAPTGGGTRSNWGNI